MSEYHTPVMLSEVLDLLVGNTSGTYIDVTFGGGGHSAGILSRLSQGGKVIAFDRDTDAMANVPDDSRFTLIHNNFRFIHNYAMLYGRSMAGMRRHKAGSGKNGSEGEAMLKDLEEGRIADGILADLGVSSHQFDTPERGFSFRFDAPLDMRMNPLAGISAEDVVNGYEESRLAGILRLYGEIDNPGRTAALIAAQRKRGRIATTGQLVKALESVTPPSAGSKYLAKVFQALRIEVNGEMEALVKMLYGAQESLKKGGRLVVITYHSLEDRIVKNFMRSGSPDGKEEKDVYGNPLCGMKPVGRKPAVPSEEEILANPRARSAKLRAAEKL